MESYSEAIYLLATNKATTALYEKSLDSLMKSATIDFMVYKCSTWEEILEDLDEWEDYNAIDEKTYTKLHSNLCKKLRRRIK